MMYKLFIALVLFHFLEHVIQISQVYLLHMSRHKAGGILGYFFPWLMHSELLHFAYALLMFLGLVYFKPETRGKERSWWVCAYYLQMWHLFEHTLLFAQATTGIYLFGKAQPTSIVQLFFPKIELHFFYNVLVIIPILLAVYQRRINENRLQENIYRKRSFK